MSCVIDTLVTCSVSCNQRCCIAMFHLIMLCYHGHEDADHGWIISELKKLIRQLLLNVLKSACACLVAAFDGSAMQRRDENNVHGVSGSRRHIHEGAKVTNQGGYNGY